VITPALRLGWPGYPSLSRAHKKTGGHGRRFDAS